MSDTMEPDTVIRLEQFLKHVGAVETGGHAKVLIQDGQVRVNGDVETRRRRQLKREDTIEVAGVTYIVGPEWLDS